MFIWAKDHFTCLIIDHVTAALCKLRGHTLQMQDKSTVPLLYSILDLSAILIEGPMLDSDVFGHSIDIFGPYVYL